MSILSQYNSQFNYYVRPIKEEDIPKVIEIRKEMGIHDCVSCLKTWLQLDPEGIRVAQLESGEVIGSISSVIGPNDFAFIGLYCVRPEYQGLGIGSNVWNSAMVHGGRRNLALHANAIKKKLYLERTHFSIEEEDFTCIKNVTADDVDPNVLSSNIPEDIKIEPFQESHLEPIYAYDFQLLGYKRTHLLELNCKEENSKTFVAMKDGDCVGFGTIKLSCLGAGRVGPLYANDNEVAEALLKILITSFPERKGFVMMTVSNNLFANRLLQKLKVPAFEIMHQLYTHRKVEVDTSKVFALYDLNGSPF